MTTKMWLLAGWLMFDAAVFVWAWWDNFYYSHDVKGLLKRIKKVFSEE